MLYFHACVPYCYTSPNSRIISPLFEGGWGGFALQPNVLLHLKNKTFVKVLNSGVDKAFMDLLAALIKFAR
jgi:hypothetical protein